MLGKLGVAALATVVAAQAQAATWTIGTAAGYPGDAASITVSIRGDGATNAAEIEFTFDEVELSLPVDGGQIPDAGRAGTCGRTGAGKVVAIVQGSGASPLASTDTVVCVVPFRIQTNARPGANCQRADQFLPASLTWLGNETDHLRQIADREGSPHAGHGLAGA
ncbi:MAG: cohesin domain-containing protein [Chiayiivirga sp.]|jgi:hypothetical protein|nr:cohesin domain-containing protein [Chiayiivirga sp.]